MEDVFIVFDLVFLYLLGTLLYRQSQQTKILKTMATKDELDAAITQLKQDVADAVKRASDALAALQAKITAGGDFTSEVKDLNDAHAALAAIAAPPPSAA